MKASSSPMAVPAVPNPTTTEPSAETPPARLEKIPPARSPSPTDPCAGNCWRSSKRLTAFDAERDSLRCPRPACPRWLVRRRESSLVKT